MSNDNFPDVFVHQAAQILSTLPHTAWQPSPTRPAGSWRTWSRSTRLVHTRLSSPQVLSMRIRTGRKTFHCFMFISKISRWSSTIKMSSIQLRLVGSFEIKIYLKRFFKDLIAAFGGLIGLCTGFSLLSLAEIIYFFTLRWWLQLCQEKRFCTAHTWYKPHISWFISCREFKLKNEEAGPFKIQIVKD